MTYKQQRFHSLVDWLKFLRPQLISHVPAKTEIKTLKEHVQHLISVLTTVEDLSRSCRLLLLRVQFRLDQRIQVQTETRAHNSVFCPDRGTCGWISSSDDTPPSIFSTGALLFFFFFTFFFVAAFSPSELPSPPSPPSSPLPFPFFPPFFFFFFFFLSSAMAAWSPFFFGVHFSSRQAGWRNQRRKNR